MGKFEMTDFFAPRVSADTAAFWQGCKEHKLVIQKCKACGKLRWPAAYLCPACLSGDTELVELSGNGEIYSYELFQKAFHPSLEDKVPYLVAAIDLDEGVRLVSNLVDCTVDEVRCGAPVQLRWADGEGYSRPVFILKRQFK